MRESSDKLQSWIDDPDDPWVGFVIERSYTDAHPESTATRFGPPGSGKPKLVRVRPWPEIPTNPLREGMFVTGERVYLIHTEDVCPHERPHRTYVCIHQGRFVE